MTPTILTLGLVLIWVGVFYVKRQNVNYQEQIESRTFWEREREANQTRKKDLSGLDYVHLELEKLPVGKWRMVTTHELKELKAMLK